MTMLFIISGCDSKVPYDLVPIEGIATYQGKPLPEEFIIVFQPSDGSRSSEGIVKKGGKFQLIHTPQMVGAKVGTNTVFVRPIRVVPEGYKEFVNQYGLGATGFPVNIDRKNSAFKLDFP
jgi:hypothetical protein